MPNAVDDMASPKPMMIAGPMRQPIEAEHGREDRSGHQHLRQAEAENVGAHRPEPRRLQLQADEEEEHHDAELGDLHDLLARR